MKYKKKNTVLKTLSFVAATAVFAGASGYKIPEQSLSGLALGVANVAGVNGADASYYNPANMAFLEHNKSELELLLTYVNLPHMEYKDRAYPAANGNSEVEKFAAPLFHFVTPQYRDDWRFGFSLVVPAGLSKRWFGDFASATADRFSLKVIEANPSAAYKINDWLALGFGARAVYSTGKIKTYARDMRTMNMELSMDMEGDSLDFGYNVAFTLKPVEALSLAATYRSEVELSVKGDANLKYPGHPGYNGAGSVNVPLPAVLDIATAYTFNKKTTIEFVYERVFWSAYENLDFSFNAGAPVAFEGSKCKGWEDSNTYRFGLSHWITDDLKLMAGFVIDKTPTPDGTLGFELPDSNSKNYSGGFEYKINDDMSIGAAYLYSDKEARKASNNANPLTPMIDGEFSEGGAHLVNLAFKYRF